MHSKGSKLVEAASTPSLVCISTRVDSFNSVFERLKNSSMFSCNARDAYAVTQRHNPKQKFEVAFYDKTGTKHDNYLDTYSEFENDYADEENSGNCKMDEILKGVERIRDKFSDKKEKIHEYEWAYECVKGSDAIAEKFRNTFGDQRAKLFRRFEARPMYLPFVSAINNHLRELNEARNVQESTESI